MIFYQEDKIYAFGGLSEDYILKTCEYFDYATKKWIRMADLNRHQKGGSVINYKDEFWLIGYLIKDSEGYLIERYIRSKNSWEIVDLKFGSKMIYMTSLLSPCENEILIFYIETDWRICKLNLMDHTIIAVPEFSDRYRKPIRVLPVDESKIMVMYKNYRSEYGFAL